MDGIRNTNEDGRDSSEKSDFIFLPPCTKIKIPQNLDKIFQNGFQLRFRHKILYKMSQKSNFP